MLDALVSLRRGADFLDSPAREDPIDFNAAPGPDDVWIKLYVRAPQGTCQFKLWSPYGREPQPHAPCTIRGETKDEWRLPYQRGALEDRTVTWSVRLLSQEHDSFELRIELFQGDEQTPLPNGRFFYAGFLEAGEIEERAGRFHFGVKAA